MYICTMFGFLNFFTIDFSSVFDIAGTSAPQMRRFESDESAIHSDWAAINGDFQAVGNDIRSACKKLYGDQLSRNSETVEAATIV